MNVPFLTVTKVYYIASCECQQTKYASGTIAMRDGDVVWLGMSEGYASCNRGKAGAHHFKSRREVIDRWLHWDGMPWWSRLKPGSLVIYKVTATKVETHTEEDVTDDKCEFETEQ